MGREQQSHVRPTLGELEIDGLGEMSQQRYLMRRRLDHARTLLQSSEPGTTVEAVARSCGFRHMGRFSVYFREMYGESPRLLLARSR